MSRNNVHTHQFRKSGKLETLLAKVRPAFSSWLETDRAFQKDTASVAMQVKKAWELYKEGDNEGRVGFARLFDSTIPEGAKSRELNKSATYNRLNYLIDQVAKDRQEPVAPREPIEEKRKRIRSDYSTFRRRFSKKPITLEAVDELLASILAEIWTEDAVKEILAA